MVGTGSVFSRVGRVDRIVVGRERGRDQKKEGKREKGCKMDREQVIEMYQLL